MKYFLLILLFSLSVFAKEGTAIRFLPVQDAGRIKPFDTFAKETLALVYGKKAYKSKDDATPVDAQWVVLTWMLSPESWANRPLFEVTYRQVVDKLELDPNKKLFSGEELFKAKNFTNLMQELQNKRESKEKLTPYFQAIQRIENQFFIFQEMASGRLLKVYPVPGQDKWLSVAEIPAEAQPLFFEISKDVASYLGLTTEPSATAEQLKVAADKLDQSVLAFEDSARKSDPAKYNVEGQMKTEVFYNDMHPFRLAYIAYLLAALTLLFIWIRNLNSGMFLAWLFVGAGFALHLTGFAFRVYLSGRPPVSNMYETVVWASFGVVLFSIILELVYRYKVFLLAGSLMGLFALIVADSAPAILDPSLQPLEAVLRSNYWLVVHVMTISISYAAFLLAFTA